MPGRGAVRVTPGFAQHPVSASPLFTKYNNKANTIMEKHLDFTIDFETCALTANAAVMQVAVVPWNRGDGVDPFLGRDVAEPFVGYVDLRTCVVDGFDFDPATVKWWSERSGKAKDAVTKGLAEPVTDVLMGVLDYIRGIVAQFQLESVCLWCQGEDVDIAILRNMCRKYDVDLEDIVPHTSFRDCRTVILEAALREAERSVQGKSTMAAGIVLPSQVLAGSYDTYRMFAPLPERYADGEAHDALFDAVRSSWNTWQALNWLRLS